MLIAILGPFFLTHLSPALHQPFLAFATCNVQAALLCLSFPHTTPELGTRPLALRVPVRYVTSLPVCFAVDCNTMLIQVQWRCTVHDVLRT
jgi:hypothetical protein